MRKIVLWLCLIPLSIAQLSPSQPSAAPKPLKIGSVQPVIASPPAPPAFTETVLVEFSAAPPATVNVTDPSLWNITVYYDDGSRTLFRGVDQATWSWFSIDPTGVATTTTNSTPAQTHVGGVQPAITVTPDKRTAFVVLPQDALFFSPQKNTVSLSVWIGTALGVWTYSKQKPSTAYFQPAPDQSSADNYLTGSYSPAIHSAPQYSIDGQGTLDFQIGSRLYLGAVATVKTDNRPSANPDSFLVSGQLQWIPINQRFLDGRAQGVLVNGDFAGLEFDRATTTKTFVSSFTAEMPLRLYPAPQKTLGKLTSGMFPFIGATTGTNLSNALEPGGSGFIFRGVFGTSIAFTYKIPNVAWMQQISLTGADTARIPATNEIFTSTHYISATGKTVSLPVLSTRIRNHVASELDLTVAKPFSISVKFENGELPPAFKTIGNKVTIGVKIALQQTGGVQTKISPEK